MSDIISATNGPKAKRDDHSNNERIEYLTTAMNMKVNALLLFVLNVTQQTDDNIQQKDNHLITLMISNLLVWLI
jgi:hypothetical protein